jgi:hypothetical protein
LAAPYVDTYDENVAARLRWGVQTCRPSQENFRSPRDSLWIDQTPKPATHDVAGDVAQHSTVEAIFTELGYLGDAIH